VKNRVGIKGQVGVDQTQQKNKKKKNTKKNKNKPINLISLCSWMDSQSINKHQLA